jgi:hypothetical protein
MKRAVIIFLDFSGLVHKEFVPPGFTVNQKYYLGALGRLRNRMMRVQIKTEDYWIIRASSLQTRRHTALSVREFLAKNCIFVLPHAPNLLRFNFCLFPKSKYNVKV